MGKRFLTITLQFLHNQRHRHHNNQAKWSIKLLAKERKPSNSHWWHPSGI